MDNKERFLKAARVFLLIAFVLCSLVTFAGALNYAHISGHHAYTVFGLASLVTVVYAAVTFYRKHLKD